MGARGADTNKYKNILHSLVSVYLFVKIIETKGFIINPTNITNWFVDRIKIEHILIHRIKMKHRHLFLI